MAFGSWIRILRKRMELSQGALALLLGIHWTTLSRWERGLAQPSLGELLEIARHYADYATNLDGWIHARQVMSLEGAGKLAFFNDHGSPLVGSYVEQALHCGERVVVACDGTADFTHVLNELTLGSGTWPVAVETGQIERVELQRVWGKEGEGFRPKIAVADMLAADQAARDAGYSGVRWLCDLRSLRDDEELVEKLIIINRAVDVFYSIYDQERALVIYPPTVLDDNLGGLLLSLQPRLITGKGVLENPFYEDRHLTTAVRMLEAATMDVLLEG